MESTKEQVSTLEGSLNFLITSMSKACNYITRDKVMDTKPFWVNQTQKFSSLFSRIRNNIEAVESFRQKVVVPIYETHNVNLINKLINSDGVVQDDFLKVEVHQSNDFRIKITPGGIYMQLDKLFLPISEVYTQSVNYSLSHPDESTPFPVQILIGFYSSVYHSVKDKEDEESMNMLKENIDILLDSLESCDQPAPQNVSKGPVDMLQSMLGNIDLGQIGEMMGKVTGDPQASKEFGEVFGKMTEVIKKGGNPLEAMGDIIKEASVRAHESDGQMPSGPVPSPVSITPDEPSIPTPEAEDQE